MRFLAIALTAVRIVVSVVAIVGAFALLARRLLGTGGGPRVTATVGPYRLLGNNQLIVCAIPALRVLVPIFRPDR